MATAKVPKTPMSWRSASRNPKSAQPRSSAERSKRSIRLSKLMKAVNRLMAAGSIPALRNSRDGLPPKSVTSSR
jgi:hypothetical protein